MTTQKFQKLPWKTASATSRQNVPPITCFFYKQHFYNEGQAEIDKKTKQMLSNTLRLN